MTPLDLFLVAITIFALFFAIYHINIAISWQGKYWKEKADKDWATYERNKYQKLYEEVIKEEEPPMYLACGCEVGEHDNTMDAIYDNHPEIIRIQVPFGSTVNIHL